MLSLIKWVCLQLVLLYMVVLPFIDFFFLCAWFYFVPTCYWWMLALFALACAPRYFDGSDTDPSRDGTWPLIQRGPLWRMIRDYFSIQYFKLHDLDPKRQYIFAYHPHCHWLPLASGCALMGDVIGMDKIFPGLKFRGLTHWASLFFPVIRQWCIWHGVFLADKAVARKVIDNGYCLFVFPGGDLEGILNGPGDLNVYVKRRQGFVRLALETGCPLVPCFIYGETDIYGFFPVLSWFREKFYKMTHLDFPAYLGRWGSPIPHQAKVTYFSGAPIEVPHIPHPSKEQVDEYHQKYIQALVQLYETTKDRVGCTYPLRIM